MRNSMQLAALTVTIGMLGGANVAFAGSIAGRAGDIGRSIEKVAAAHADSSQQDEDTGSIMRIPLPSLRQAGLGTVPLPTPMPSPRGGFQLASIENPYLAAMPTLIKPRLLDGPTGAIVRAVEPDNQPRPRFVTWMRDSEDDNVVPGGRRQACFHCLLKRKASKHGVPFRLARAVVKVESNYRRDAVGGVGEIGLMQIRPQTARWLGFAGADEELFNPRNNLEYGVKYLGKAWRLGEGSLCRTILKYNAGHNAKKMNPMSQRYCDKVEAILERGEGPIRQASL